MSFSFDFTKEKLEKCMPGNPKVGDWYSQLVQNLPDYNITTLERVAQWLAQMGHESGDFKTTTENLNYRTTALTAMFGNRISAADAAKHGRNDATGQKANQEAIANCIYGGDWGRKNLGNTQTGDGWKFRGRGLTQVTGRSNYTACSKALYGDLVLVDDPGILAEPDGAVRSACWFWNSRNLNNLADKGDTKGVTKLINGGDKGLDDRLARYDRALKVLRG
jgi:putative chitinase